MSTILAPEIDAEQLELEIQRDRLLHRLRAQRIHGAHLWDWYHGRQDYPAVQRRYADGYRLLLDIARTPWARLVVDTIAERLHVQGFRADQPAAAGAALEQAAWQLYRDSSMDADEWLVYTEALITGRGYVSISLEEGAARLAPESGFEVTHEPEPGNRRRVAAGLKLYPATWTARDWTAELYRPEATYRWHAATGELGEGEFPIDNTGRAAELIWEPAEFEIPNPLAAVPLVPFENRATVLGGGVSELEDCLPILRRIDKLTLDKLMTSEFASFPQKWATGLEIPIDPETGQRTEPFKVAVDRLWVAEGEGGKEVKFGAFPAADLAPYLSAIDADIAALAAISRVPAHYLIQSSLANPPSAESLIAAESGLVAKVQERQRRFGEAWERAVRLALELDGGADTAGLEVIWADAEMRNPAQVADAATKLATIGIPDRALWEYVGATPQQVAAWTLDTAAAELAAAAATPPGAGPS